MSFNNYLEPEDDKKYYHKNSLSYYYDKMADKEKLIKELAKKIEGYDKEFTKKIEGYNKELSEKVEGYDRLLLETIVENNETLESLTNFWDSKMETFDDGVTDLLTEWAEDATFNNVLLNTKADKIVVESSLNSVRSDLTQKANQSYVDTKVNAMASGTPKIVRQSYTQLPSIGGTEKLALVLDDGHKYYDNGTTWVDAGVYEAVEVADGSITEEKTGFLPFLRATKNMFDVNSNNIVKGQYLSADGSLNSLAAYNTSDYMALGDEGFFIASGENIATLPTVRAYAFYDRNLNFLSGDSSNVAPFIQLPIAVPENAIYVRVSYPVQATKYQVEMGRTVTPYESFNPIFTLSESIELRPTNIGRIITPELTTFINKRPVKNLFNPNDPDNLTGKVLNADGTLSDNVNYSTTGFMPVSDGDKVHVSRESGDHNIIRAYAFYDAGKVFISGVSQHTPIITTPLTVPSNAKFLRITYTANNVKFQVEVGGVTGYSPYEEAYVVDGNMVKLPYVDTEQKSRWEGKTIVWNGDSITHGNGYKSYAKTVSERLGANLVNYAIGGSTIAVNPNRPADRNPIVQRYTIMQNTADLVVNAAGTNDWAYSWSEIGTMASRDETSFYGALHILSQGLIEKYIKKRLLFMTPIKRGDLLGQTPTAKNANGLTLRNYADIIIEVASFYGIPVLDMYNETPIFPFIDSHINGLIPDRVHPNDAGQLVIADRVEGYLNQL